MKYPSMRFHLTAASIAVLSLLSGCPLPCEFGGECKNLADQTITFDQPAPGRVGTTATLVASASSGLAVYFKSLTTSTCTVNDKQLSFLAVGTCTVNAQQQGDDSFKAANLVSRDITVLAPAGPAAQTITFNPAAAGNVGESITLAATASSGLAVTLASTTQGVCTVSGTTLSPISPGNCTVTANQNGDSSFSIAPQVTKTISIAAATGTIFQNITTNFSTASMLTNATRTLNATASSGLPLVITTTTPSVCAVSGAVLTSISNGTCTVKINQYGNSTFAPATETSVAITVGTLT